jgi:enterochelin esterase-like enzyme
MLARPIAIVVSAVALLCPSLIRAQDAPITPRELREALAAKPSGDAATALAERVRRTFGKDLPVKGANARINNLDAAWAIELPKYSLIELPSVVSEDGSLKVNLERVGETPVFAAVRTLQEGTAMRYAYRVNGIKGEMRQLEAYQLQPEHTPDPNVPRGKLTQQPKWKSNVFAGTERDWWVYVPAQYTPDKPACVMVFQDGGSYTSYVPTVFDNLIAKGEMPVTVAVFINPGTFMEGGRSNRSFEYDTLSDQYARFLLEEILPEVEKSVKLSHDPECRAIAGASSGGICAWTVAWERPNEFRKVLSWIGSFTNIASGTSRREGGHNYPALIRKTENKPIRIFLQDGSNDLDNIHGNWPLANQQMVKALEFKKYDYKFVYGNGFHSHAHGRAILPESLRWLWRKP